MIRVLGAEGTREYEAAQDLRGLILRSWPDVAAHAACDIRIVAGAKCHGQRVRDIDVLLLASFAEGISFAPFYEFVVDGRAWRPDMIEARSLCVVIEVKDHVPEDVRFRGTAAEVRYGDRWHDASEQNEAQLYSVKNYLEQHNLRAPHITPLLWLRNVPATALPHRPHPILGAPVTWELILNVITQISPPRWIEGRWVLTSARDDVSVPLVADLFTKEIQATRLDRRRVERILQRTVDIAPLLPLAGSKLTVLRGQGGTGKTMRLVQLAGNFSEREGARVLLLTYNRALVADIRRLLTIIGIRDDIVGGSIHIQTAHSFFYAVLRGLGILADDGTEFIEEYERLKDEALAYLAEGAVSAEDIESLVRSDFETFRWDYVFIDEGQDWPQNEHDLLLHLYPPSRIVVADGIDQLVRQTESTNWRAGLQRGEYAVVPLSVSLRMKAGVARFVSAAMRRLGLLQVRWEANENLPGGRVIVVDGPYLHNRALHDRLMRANEGDGNAPVDMLFCVPPSLARPVAADDPPRSSVAAVFEGWGLKTWDGVLDDVRGGYPTELNQLRIVQYDSCRGLEGWISVNLALDRFYEHKLATFEATAAPLRPAPGILAGDRTAAEQFAARWLSIPLTRAMDTLVVQIEADYSPVRRALEAAATECSDYVEWLAFR